MKKYYISSPPLCIFVDKKTVSTPAPVKIKKVFYDCMPLVHKLSGDHNNLSQQTTPVDQRNESKDENKNEEVVDRQQTDLVELDQKIYNDDRPTLIQTANEKTERIFSDIDDDDFVHVSNDY